MSFKIAVDLSYTTTKPCALLLQIEALDDANQQVQSNSLDIDGMPILNRINGDNGVGHRIWLQSGMTFDCKYEATVETRRENTDLTKLGKTPLVALTEETTPYLMGSRYCHPEHFFDFVGGKFGALQGGAFVSAACDWINSSFDYDPFASHAGTTASETFDQRKGVCRDYAHVLIAMCRAKAIPARFVSCYGPRVSPQDFHAIAEVYLDGAWHLVDATGMANPADTIMIGVGSDAADVSFMTSYGWMELKRQIVSVTTL